MATIYQCEFLSESEITALKGLVIGYGNMKKATEDSDIPRGTLRDIINKGYGLPANIEKIRNHLLKTNDHHHSCEVKV